MTDHGLKGEKATQTWQANEREIAEAALRRQAKAARPIADTGGRADPRSGTAGLVRRVTNEGG